MTRSARGRPRKGAAASTPALQAWKEPQGLVKDLLQAFARNDLMTYSSAIGFQILTAVIPFFLFVFALAGLFHLDGLWHDHMAPEVRAHVSSGFYRVINEAVGKALGSKQVLWASFGGALALWQVSGAVRAVMGVFDRIYDTHAERSFVRRYLVSAALSIAVGACFVLSALCLALAPFFTVVHPPPGWGLVVMASRGLLAGGFLLLAVGLLFKVGAAPFHAWTPDVYQGAPTAVTAFMAACTKIAAFGALLRVFYVAFGALRWDWQPMMWLAVGLLVRAAPSKPIPLPWVSLGAALVIACWLAASLVFYLYLTRIASYDSIFGGLASVIVVLAYLYLSVTAFLFGTQVDVLVRQRAAARTPASQRRGR